MLLLGDMLIICVCAQDIHANATRFLLEISELAAFFADEREVSPSASLLRAFDFSRFARAFSAFKESLTCFCVIDT